MKDTLSSSIASQRQEIKSERMDMSFGEIINMYKDNELVISPEYQRSFRWDVQRQTDFIESILLGIPFPSIFVAANEDGKWELIDGLQRISTVLSFFGELIDSDRNNLRLEAGSIVTDTEGITIDTLPFELKLLIKRTPCRVEIIQRESNFDMRYELFKRLNTGGEGLTRQEIRNCVFRGFENYRYFNEMIVSLSENNDFRNVVLISEDKINEKLFEEIVLRFFALYYYIREYTEKTIEDFFDKIMSKQSESPETEKIDGFRIVFESVFKFLNSSESGQNTFRLSRLNFSTSMYDAVVLALASNHGHIEEIDIDDFLLKVETLKNNEEFRKYAGSASSNRINIEKKLAVAKSRIL